jgi:hypothetical protein
MRKVAIAVAAVMALLVGGALAWTAQATPLVGTPPAKNYSPVEKVACGGPGPRCPWGSRWACGPYGGCGCVPCGGGYWYRPWRY